MSPLRCPGHITHHCGPSKAEAWKRHAGDTPGLQLIPLPLQALWTETSAWTRVRADHPESRSVRGGGQAESMLAS